jgi:hypothetical protein
MQKIPQEEQSARNHSQERKADVPKMVGQKVLPDRISGNITVSFSSSNENESYAPRLNISWDSQSHNIFEITQSLR